MSAAFVHVVPPEGGRSQERRIDYPVPMGILWGLLDRTTRIALLGICDGDSQRPNVAWEELSAPVRFAIHRFIVYRYTEPRIAAA